MTAEYVPADPGFTQKSPLYRSTHKLGTHAVYLNKETKTALIVVTKSQSGPDYAISAGVVGWFDHIKERGGASHIDFVADDKLVRRVDLAAVVAVLRLLKPQKSKRDGMPDFYWVNPADFGLTDDDEF